MKIQEKDKNGLFVDSLYQLTNYKRMENCYISKK